MTTTTTRCFCDVCGKEVKNRFDLIAIRTNLQTDSTVYCPIPSYQKEVCPDCLCRLNEGVNDMLCDAIVRKSAKRNVGRRRG